MPELLQGFLLGVVLALGAGALMIYLHRVNAPPPQDRATDRREPDPPSPEERHR